MIRDALQGDVSNVAEIARAGFPEALLRFTIMGSDGYDEYVLDRILDCASGHARFRVASSRSDTRGFAEWRLEGTAAHLNNIFVAEPYRGSGIGTALLADLFAWVDSGVSSVSAHAFVDNSRANAWYRSLGMTEAGRRYWMVLGNPPDFQATRGVDAPRLFDEASADSRLRYGFDHFFVEFANDRFQIGRLPGGVLRYVAESPDSRVIEWLGHHPEGKEALVISGTPKIPGELVGVQVEYACSLECLAEQLGVRLR